MKNITLLLLLTLLAAFVFASPEAEAAPAPDQYGPNQNGGDVWESNSPPVLTQQDHSLTVLQWGKRACKTKAPNVQRAIERYCSMAPGAGGRVCIHLARLLAWNQVANEAVQQNVPGARGSRGERVGNAIVSIDAGCNPAQWLPWDVCFKQFYNVSRFPLFEMLSYSGLDADLVAFNF
jgi:hypothetical protein